MAAETTAKACSSQAMWGSHIFALPGTNASNSSGAWDGQFSYKAELDVEQQETTEAQNPILNKGEEKQKSFAIRVIVNTLADGLDPLKVHKSLCDSAGKKARFYIGAKPIDKSYYFLQSVDLRFSNIDISAGGKPYRAEIELQFVEDTVQRKETADNSNVWGEKGKKTAAKVGASKTSKSAIWD